MAFGRRSRITALLIGALASIASCSAPTAGPVSTPTEALSATTTTTQPPTTSTTTAVTTTSAAPTTTTQAGPSTSTLAGTGAEIRVPEGDGPFPAVVLVHGGGWVAGDPSVMSQLAVYLTENGFLTVNTTYKLATEDAGFPEAVDDVTCAARLAAAHPDSDGRVTLLGHSAGAHLAALVALSGPDYGADCPHPEAPLPERLIGLAGPYDVNRLGIVMLPFFGGGPAAEPDAWEAGNPLNLVAGNTGLSSLIMYGENDTLVDPDFAVEFHLALVGAGLDATLELVEGARHMDLRDPEFVGELLVTWLARDS